MTTRTGRVFRVEFFLLAVMAALWPAPSFALSSRALIAVTGAAASDELGYSVSIAGDVNGDGYPDVIVGVPGADAGGANAGRAYVYFGGPNADGVPDLVLTGTGVLDEFGYSVGAAGDVNGDGYDDVIVGALYNDAGGTDAGRAYVYFGGPSPDSTPDLVLTGAAAGDNFGICVGTAGDVNRDGYDDVIVGAPGNDAGGTNTGRAYVYFGGASPNAVADWTLTGTGAFGFGSSVGTAGDVNGDGYDDVIVGEPDNNAAGLNAGRAYVFFGGPFTIDTVADLTLTGAAAGDFFGTSVAAAGDVNGDGYADVIVGAPYNDTGGTDIGRAYVYYGGAAPNAVADLTLTGTAPSDEFGQSVGTAGDVNGDGYADVIVGEPLYDSGRAFIYLGGPSADAIPDLTLRGQTAADQFGTSVGTAGDVNGDGHDDVIAGAPFNNATGGNGFAYVEAIFPYQIMSPNGGELWVAGSPVSVSWLGTGLVDIGLSTDGGATYQTVASSVGGDDQNQYTVTAPSGATEFAKVRVSSMGSTPNRTNSDVSDRIFRIVTPTAPPAAASRLQHAYLGAGGGDSYGLSVATVGDVNGDGYPDVIVGAPFNDAGGTDAGRAYVYFGGPKSDNTADLVLTGAAANDWFGLSVGSAGDVNGDGYPDLIVGAPGSDAGGVDAGRAYIYFGGPAADNVADITMTGAAAGDWFGWSVGTAGDLNKDGYADVIVGAPNNDAAGTDAGRAYVYFGGPGADNVADLILTGVAAGDNFGASAGTAGDMNGDGYADVIVGAYLNKAGGPNAGRAYVYYGGASPDNAPDLTFTGATGDNLGNAVAAAGDVNGDGYADVIVGADTYAGGSDVGRAYVFFGGPGADALPDMTLTGAAPGDFFGSAVGAAGDVNDDGYADVIVGADTNDAGGTDAGRAYVYYGGPGADNVPDLTFTGVAGENLGSSVGTAGDLNGDGFSDVVAGARASAGTGVAYVYDVNRYHLLSPVGGETWNVGASKTISWLGAEKADLWLSTDAGRSFERIASGAGGSAANLWNLRVPHSPGKFTMIKVTPTDGAIRGFDQSDSMFTIQTSVSLLALLAARMPDRRDAATVTWNTDPGPQDLAGYRLEKAAGAAGAPEWRTVASLTKETSYSDLEAGPGGARYRLFAVNGFGDELMLGEAALEPMRALSAWPLPYRGGSLSVTFATGSGWGGAPAPADVSLYDVRGRLVRTIVSGAFAPGYQAALWDGKDGHGHAVAAGVYLLRARSAGQEKNLKVIVLR